MPERPDRPVSGVAVKLLNCSPLRAFVVLILALWLSTLVAGLAEHFLFHLQRFRWSPFFPDYSGSDDFLIYKDRFRFFHQQSFFIPWRNEPISYARFPFTYPAPAAVVFHLLFLFGRFSERVLFATFLIGALAAALLLARALVRRGLAALSTILLIVIAGPLSYPILFAIDRGNIELLNVLLVWASIACVWRRWWYAGAILLGLAIGLKLFPFVLVGIFVAQRKYLQSLTVIATAAVSTLLSYLSLGPTFAAARAGTASGLAFFQQQYVLSFDLTEAGFDHSLFTLVKLVQRMAHHLLPEIVGTSLGPWLRGYLVVCVLGGLIFFFGRIVRLPLVNQIVILVAVSVLLPPLSADYTLVHLYAPFACLALVAVSAASPCRPPQGLVLALLLLAVLFGPEGFLFLHGLRLAGLLKTSALVLLVCVASILPWEDDCATKVLTAQQDV